MSNVKLGERDLWQAVYEAFPYPPDCVQDEINRIASKCLNKALGWTQSVVLNSATCDVREVVIGGDEISTLIRYHQRTNVSGNTTPIVIVQAGGKNVLIEGNNRVNKWVNECDLAPRRALVLVPHECVPTG